MSRSTSNPTAISFDNTWQQLKAGLMSEVLSNSSSLNYFIGLQQLHTILSQANYLMHLSLWGGGSQGVGNYYKNFDIGPESTSYEFRYSSWVSPLFYTHTRTHARTLWKYTEQDILITFDIRTHWSVVDVFFGIKRHNCWKVKTKRINCIILIAKLWTSIYRKTNAFLPLSVIFENQLQYA